MNCPGNRGGAEPLAPPEDLALPPGEQIVAIPWTWLAHRSNRTRPAVANRFPWGRLCLVRQSVCISCWIIGVARRRQSEIDGRGRNHVGLGQHHFSSNSFGPTPQILTPARPGHAPVVEDTSTLRVVSLPVAREPSGGAFRQAIIRVKLEQISTAGQLLARRAVSTAQEQTR